MFHVTKHLQQLVHRPKTTTLTALCLTFQDGVHGTTVQRVPEVMNRWHEENFLGSFWQKIHDEFRICRNTLHGFIQRLSCSTGQYRASMSLERIISLYTWFNTFHATNEIYRSEAGSLSLYSSGM